MREEKKSPANSLGTLKEPAPPRDGPGWDIDHRYDQLTYEMLTARFLAHDELLWQTPVLALTAQSFLMTISLSPEVDDWAGATAAGLGTVLILMSMHLLGRHRFLELIEKHKLRQLEEILQIEPLSTHSWGWNYASAPELGKAFSHKEYGLQSPRYYRVFAVPSYRIWQVGLGLFAIANAVIFIVRALPMH
ncbi:MAG: putative rane protein [Pseudarthrobacter sp.]|nr:putative rane protein [Pseudarthrobacter sp.]